MNAWFSRASRFSAFSAVSMALASVGALAWSGCGSDGASVTCDNAGNCMQCDGYGCSAVSTSGTTIDGGTDSGATVHHDAGAKPDAKPAKPDAKADSGVKADSGAKTDGLAGDAGTDVSTKPVCGGVNGPCACATVADCSSGEDCVAGACEPAASVCTLSSQCAGGKVCANGQCVTACGGGVSCASGFTCTNSVCEPTAASTCSSNADCTSTAPYCVSGSCALACTADAQCPSGDYCDQGACVLDTRPHPDCTGNSDCESGQVCQGGYCLYTCTTSMQCDLIDARIPICAMNVCRSVAEANPACTTQAQCASGQSCISNTCQ